MADSQPIDLLVITPERQVLEASADAVVIPAHDGELGVLRDRAPVLCELGIGQLRYTQAGVPRRVFIDGGFAQVIENHVTVLTSRALPADQITKEVVAAAERAVEEHTGLDAESRDARERAHKRLSVLRSMHTTD